MTAERREPVGDDRPAPVEERLRAASFKSAPAEARMRGLKRILAEFRRLYGGGRARSRDRPGDSE
jgi:hypothetical protein